jgi:hypothetical protein
MTDTRSQGAQPGFPPAHIIRAALHAGGLIDAFGSPVPAARSTYLLYPSDALYPPGDLRLGEKVLIDCGLLVEKEGLLFPTPALKELLSIDEDMAISIVFERAILAVCSLSHVSLDNELSRRIADVAQELIRNPERREAILISFGRKYDDSLRQTLGLLGEEAVVSQAREELVEIGREDLAAEVRRVSEFADDLGYDIVAPRLNGNRRLEVKTSGRDKPGLLHFFISRTEIEWGLEDSDWALVVCRVSVDNTIEITGWCSAITLEPYLPSDSAGSRWISTELEVPETLFRPGLPPCI